MKYITNMKQEIEIIDGYYADDYACYKVHGQYVDKVFVLGDYASMQTNAYSNQFDKFDSPTTKEEYDLKFDKAIEIFKRNRD